MAKSNRNSVGKKRKSRTFIAIVIAISYRVWSWARHSILHFFVFVLGVLFVCNFIFQIANKPTEILRVATQAQGLTWNETWDRYSKDFIKYHTPYVSPTTLAAIAQSESSGHQLAHPKWEFNFKRPWYRWYAPASTSVGLMQFTEGTFARASQYCIRDHKLFSGRAKGGLLSPCWKNIFLTRLSPSDSIEMTAVTIHKAVSKAKKWSDRRRLSHRQKLIVAAATHLCGVGKVKKIAQRGFKVRADERCGRHSLASYLSRMKRLERQFRPKFLAIAQK